MVQVSRVLPMSSDHTVTYVTGLYRVPPNARWTCQAIRGLPGLRPRAVQFACSYLGVRQRRQLLARDTPTDLSPFRTERQVRTNT